MNFHSFHQRSLQVLGLLLLSGMFSSKIASRLVVRAFTSSRTRAITAARVPFSANYQQFRWKTTQGVAAVEEDLDAALDSLLGDAFKEAGEDSQASSVIEETGEESHIKDSHPIPKNLVEEVSSDLIRTEISFRFDQSLTSNMLW
jgi:hypothetical protein